MIDHAKNEFASFADIERHRWMVCIQPRSRVGIYTPIRDTASRKRDLGANLSGSTDLTLFKRLISEFRDESYFEAAFVENVGPFPYKVFTEADSSHLEANYPDVRRINWIREDAFPQ